MTDQEIIAFLQKGGEATFGLHGCNMGIINLMANMQKAGLIRTEDASLSQETRRSAIWIAEDRRSEPSDAILASLNQPS